MALNMNITTSAGLSCYRELAEKEKRAAYRWETRFGKAALKARYARQDGEDIARDCEPGLARTFAGPPAAGP